jgi:hypothetical protein
MQNKPAYISCPEKINAIHRWVTPTFLDPTQTYHRNGSLKVKNEKMTFFAKFNTK